MYYTYILRCSDGSLYTGITTDVARRMAQHCGRLKGGARYTRTHTVQRLEAVWECGSRSQALRLEARIKRLKKPQKEQLIADSTLSLPGEQLPFEGCVRISAEDHSLR